MDPLITVIVPVYNTVACLEKCLDSILGQTYLNLEVILIDDGSTDGSEQICDAYAEKDSRVQVVHQENAGVARARNTAITMASGEYLMFADADDWLPKDAIASLYRCLTRDGSDMAAGKHVDVWSDGRTDPSYCDWKEAYICTGIEMIQYAGTPRYVTAAPWGKLYKKELYAGLRFGMLTYGEDFWLFPKLLMRCRKISVLNQTVYYYYRRTDSVTMAPKESNLLDLLSAFLHVTDLYLTHSFIQPAKWCFGRCLSAAIYIKNKKKAKEAIRRQFDRKTVRQMMAGQSLKNWIKYLMLYIPGLSTMYIALKQAYRRVKK